MSHRATAPNSRFPKRKQLRKDEVPGNVYFSTTWRRIIEGL